MRVVRAADELAKSLKTAMREAEAAFGVGDVYLEKYVESPRHIEIQVLGDHHGNVVHLGERECSIQRRHQKLIEEAPSVALTEKQRRKLGATVVDAARAVQYTNAGTFEFLMDPSGHFYFLEANTRLQVEHPVTEFVTGVDIVKEQIRIAAGQRLSFKQSDIEFRGHSIECRINAEDPETFVPSPGVIHAFSVPGGPGVRVDSYAHSECTVSPYYDSLIAKIITYGRDRTEAIARMRRTLEMTVVDGIKTSIPLHLKILARAGLHRRAASARASWNGSCPTEEEAGPARRAGLKPRPGSAFPRLYAILDVDLARRARARARSTLLACLARRRRPADPAARQDARVRPVPRAGRRSWRARPRAAGAHVHRQRPRRRRAHGRAPMACTSGRTTSRPRTARGGRRPRRARRRLDAQRRRRSTRRCDEPVDYLAIGPVFDTASKERPDPVVGLDGVRRAARLDERRAACRSSRSAASRSERAAAVHRRRRRRGRGHLRPARPATRPSARCFGEYADGTLSRCTV